MFDIAIIGAGPAGATLARLIGKTHRVLCVDKRPRHGSSGGYSAGKSCGGLLAPDAQKMLSELGLGLPRDVLEGPQLFAVKAIDLQSRLERHYQRHYINMDRQKFDSWLLSLIPPAVEVRTGCRLKSFSREDRGFTLNLEVGHQIFVEKAQILVGADGANSRVRMQGFPGSPYPVMYFAIQEWVEGGGDDFPYFTALFDREITDYYCWTIPKGDALVIGAALSPREQPREKFEGLKTKLRRHGFVFGKTIRREGAAILRPRRAKQISAGKDGIALIGEAGGWISPSSAEGLSYAFKGALLLAQALRPGLEGFEKRYRRKVRSLRRNLLLKNLKSRLLFHPFFRKAVMASGLRSLEVQFW